MKLIVGLGNPGTVYINTRHNSGFLFVDELMKVASSKKQVAGWNQVKIFKSDRFMNDSGSFVKKLATSYKLPATDLFVVHDDLDIALGEYKIQFGRGPKDHNGLKSIDNALGSDQYWHVRIGVDNRPLDNRPLGVEYVLQEFTEEEKETLDRVIKIACKKLATLLINTN